MTPRQHHLCAIAAGTVCLTALAALLWAPDGYHDVPDTLNDDLARAYADAVSHADDRERVKTAVVKPATRVLSYCNGRTTIDPLVSDRYLVKTGRI